MILAVGNVHARLQLATDDEREWLSSYLSFKDERSRYTGYGDGYVRLFDRVTQKFPAGFAPLIMKSAPREGFPVEVVEVKTAVTHLPFPGVDPTADLTWLRPYQREMIDAVVQHRRGILKAPTGSGKGSVVAGMVLALPCRWLFLVHRNTLIMQQAERIQEQAGIHPGIVAEGIWEPFAGEVRVVCASFQTLARALTDPKRRVKALELLRAAEGVAIDEAHTLPAATFYAVAMETVNAYYRVGLSATPLARGDRRSTYAVGALGPVIYTIKPEVLIQAGVLARPSIRMLRVTQESSRPSWQGVYGELVVRSKDRNARVVEAVRRAEKPCLVFVKELHHGRALEKALGKAGLTSAFVSGEHSTDWRRSHVKRLEKGHFDALIASVVFQEGVDIPDLRSVVVACGGKSVIAALQRIGRGMRVAPGKSTFEVWDFMDAGHTWTERQARARMRAYVREGYDVVEEG